MEFNTELGVFNYPIRVWSPVLQVYTHRVGLGRIGQNKKELELQSH